MKGLVIFMGSNSNSHLTGEDRKVIEQGITNSETKASIAATLGKDKSTIGKEIKLHRIMTHKCQMPHITVITLNPIILDHLKIAYFALPMSKYLSWYISG